MSFVRFFSYFQALCGTLFSPILLHYHPSKVTCSWCLIFFLLPQNFTFSLCFRFFKVKGHCIALCFHLLACLDSLNHQEYKLLPDLHWSDFTSLSPLQSNLFLMPDLLSFATEFHFQSLFSFFQGQRSLHCTLFPPFGLFGFTQSPRI